MGGMTPGTYIVSAQYSSGGQQFMVHRKATIKVAERAFMLYLAPGSAVNGKLSVGSSPAFDLQSVRVAPESIDPDLPSPAIAGVDANGQFSLPRVEPGEYILRTVNLPADVYVKSIRTGDVDAQTKPLVIRYASPEPIRVDLGVDGGRLDGWLSIALITRSRVRPSPSFPMRIAGILRISIGWRSRKQTATSLSEAFLRATTRFLRGKTSSRMHI
jgi:hypothetical protein